jgi:hypothetical protein
MCYNREIFENLPELCKPGGGGIAGRIDQNKKRGVELSSFFLVLLDIDV